MPRIIARKFAFVLLALPAAALSADGDTRFDVKLLAGGSWQVKNDVQIPNSELGTRFSLADTVGEGAISRRDVLQSIADNVLVPSTSDFAETAASPVAVFSSSSRPGEDSIVIRTGNDVRFCFSVQSP